MKISRTHNTAEQHEVQLADVDDNWTRREAEHLPISAPGGEQALSRPPSISQ